MISVFSGFFGFLVFFVIFFSYILYFPYDFPRISRISRLSECYDFMPDFCDSRLRNGIERQTLFIFQYSRWETTLAHFCIFLYGIFFFVFFLATSPQQMILIYKLWFLLIRVDSIDSCRFIAKNLWKICCALCS